MPPKPPSPSLATASPAWLALLAALAAAALAWHGPIPQWPDYHHFANHRAWLGLPNAADVLSNLPFALVGVWGFAALRDVGDDAARRAWRAFAVAIGCTAVGSAVYHGQPGNTLLAFDRLPIAWACAVLGCAFLGLRVDTRWASRAALVAALAIGSASVAWWWLTERQGTGDLRPYLFMQFLPTLLIPAGLALRLRRPGPPPDGQPRGSDWLVALSLYGLAKACELGDGAVLQATAGVVSGHTLKHLLAAAAAGWLLRAAARRSRR